MTCDYLSLATPGVQRLKPYQPGKPLEELEREYGISEAVKLASNENPLGPSPQVMSSLQALCNAEGLARYPDGGGFDLKQALASHCGVQPEQITLGNGSNDVLELIARAFATSDEAILFSQHAFAVYPLATQAIGAEMQMIPAKNWGNDLDAMLAGITDKTRVIFLANPNNPTGTWVNKDALSAFLAKVPENVIMVLDEAYVEYVDDPAYPNGLDFLAQYPNLIVTRTFSKAYGLAGLRMGYALSSSVIADLLNRVRQPFNANTFAMSAAVMALQDTAHLQNAITLNRAGMQQFTEAFNAMGLDYIPSVGNFIAANMGQSGDEVYDKLLHEGVIVRPVTAYGMPNHLRISIGLEQENDACIAALKKVL